MEPGQETSETARRLYWGPGRAPAGWIRLAGPDGAAPDLTCNIVHDGLPFDSESIELALCRYAPQSLGVYDLLQALREIWRVLAPGGTLRLVFHDLDKAIAAYKAGARERFWPTDWSTLGGNFVVEILEHNEVQTLLTPEFAREVIESAGFENIRSAEEVSFPAEWPEANDGLREMSSCLEAVKSRHPAGAHSPGPAREVHLSWNEDPATTVTVLWRTVSGEGGGFVELRLAPGDAWVRTPASQGEPSSEGVLHEATLRGLAPGSEIEYRVPGDSGASPPVSEVFRTRTAPGPEAEDFSFAFICDTGIVGRADGRAEGIRRVIAELLAQRPLFVLGGGDYAYADHDGRFPDAGPAVSAWFRQMEPLISRAPFLAQYGNHDTASFERYRDWAPCFGRPQEGWRHYSFDVMDAHFAGLFVPRPILERDDLDWIDRDLEAARARGTRWLIVWQHEPVFASGRSHPADPRVRDALAPVFERHGVDLHLSGHDQSYERTHPLRIGRDVFSWAGSSPGSCERGAGVIYAKVSPGGKLSDIGNDFSRFTRKQQPWMAARDDSAHHYAMVTVLAKGELSFEAFAVPSDDAPARRIDAFRIHGSAVRTASPRCCP